MATSETAALTSAQRARSTGLVRAAAHPYRGLRAVLATIHGKERAIAPPLARHLGLSLNVYRGFDTDQLGTFTGETPRSGTMAEAASKKAQVACRSTGARLGLGSEGSFGPHPAFYFAACDTEVIALHDAAMDITIIDSVVSLRTNYDHLDLGPEADLDAFLARVGFPVAGLVVGLVAPAGRASAYGAAPLKGIRDRAQLERACSTMTMLAEGQTVRVSTDMRAHMNPLRMGVIRAAATRLARRLQCLCPECSAPGFGKTSAEAGLPCADCGAPTGQLRAWVLGCVRCSFTQSLPLAAQPAADPRHCQLCNP